MIMLLDFFKYFFFLRIGFLIDKIEFLNQFIYLLSYDSSVDTVAKWLA